MTRRWIPLPMAVLTLMSGCASSATQPGVATESRSGNAATGDTPPGIRFVLVRENAWLRTAPDASAERARVSAHAATPDRVVVFRLLREQGEWLAIQTPGGRHAESHCHLRLTRLDPYRVTLFVRRDDVVQTTTREVTARYADGTFATLAPGVELVPAPLFATGGRPVYTVYADGLMFNTWLDADAVGTSYVPTQRTGEMQGESLLRSVDGVRFGSGARVATYGTIMPTIVVSDRRDEHDHATATLQTGCIQLRAQVNAGDVFTSSGTVSGAEGPDAVTSPFVSHATRVYWADGRSAGSVRRDTTLGPEVAPGGGRRCFQTPLRGQAREDHPDRSLRFCFDPGDVR